MHINIRCVLFREKPYFYISKHKYKTITRVTQTVGLLKSSALTALQLTLFTVSLQQNVPILYSDSLSIYLLLMAKRDRKILKAHLCASFFIIWYSFHHLLPCM